ncbi:hypothetical protein LJC32_04675, partial [Oscillospiraceae bacterium OttesenSCG-928-F05]|nr:hypothetical protein [Oscillospiraceae bacterium OttesenSCG-928-F05]
NISMDGDKTKSRVEAAWKPATREQKQEIEELCGLKRVSIQRVYKTGSISVKIALAMAQVLDIDPFYLVGESEEPGTCTEEALTELFLRHGSETLLKKQLRINKKRAKEASVQPVEPTPPVANAEPVIPAEPSTPAEPVPSPAPADDGIDTALEGMSEEDTFTLWKALLLRAKYDDKSKELVRQMKRMLLS